MIKHISNKLTNEVIDYVLQEYERVQRLEVPFINGFYDESTIQEYVDSAIINYGCLKILANIGTSTSLKTIKNHHFFTTHLWLSPEYFNKVKEAVYLNAHHDVEKPARVLDVIKRRDAFVAKLECGEEYELVSPPFGDEDEFDVNRTLGVRFTDLTTPSKYYQYNPAYNSFKLTESNKRCLELEVVTQ